MDSHIEETGNPSHQNATRSTKGGAKLKFIKSLGSKVLQKTNINVVSFGFLKTENICPTLFNFVSQETPFVLIIEPSNIPA
jgi:cytochrome oxidase Cu insertion factor (SCO1/SenC/PrrC family)